MELKNLAKSVYDSELLDKYARILCMLQKGMIDCAKQGNQKRSIFIINKSARDVCEEYDPSLIMIPDIHNDGAPIKRIEGIATFYDDSLPDDLCIVMSLKYWHERKRLLELEDIK